ncbi:hypothetical protein [Cohnella sp. AR92]|uniref:hypothetical protein n=1 Tax=Cohnella sp. AR92 TaxID=648716 RepID=UPI000F8D72F8|nr:hypothetical protein [Cohnella sp. AR92]RUS48150.1 hypothetical protein ELR57_06355 [Cohnella sp. AR92]
MKNRTDSADWTDRRLRQAERWLVKAAALLAILLVVAQIALHIPTVRHLLTNTDEWEGIPYDSSFTAR